MEDLISIVVLILYFVAASASKKKKKHEKAQKKAAKRRNVQFEKAFDKIRHTTDEKDESMPVSESVPKSAYPQMRPEQEGTDPCHEEMLIEPKPAMYLGYASPEEMQAAGEGEDPCHFGQAQEESSFAKESPVYRSPIFNPEDKDALRQDVLRGVIMSEVLKRPDCCIAASGMKRRA